MAKKRTNITEKRVQASENDPPPQNPGDVPLDHNPEPDEDGWDELGLTIKQKRFCEAYVGEAGGNAMKAGKLAGYKDDNYWGLAATVRDNVKKPQIRAYIARLLARQGITGDYLKSRLATIAHSSMDNFLTVDAKGDVVLDMEQAARLGALGQLKEFREETVELGENVLKRKRTVKIHDPVSSIRTLAEMLGILVQQHNVTLNGQKGYVGVSPDDWNARKSAGNDRN